MHSVSYIDKYEIVTVHLKGRNIIIIIQLVSKKKRYIYN